MLVALPQAFLTPTYDLGISCALPHLPWSIAQRRPLLLPALAQGGLYAQRDELAEQVGGFREYLPVEIAAGGAGSVGMMLRRVDQGRSRVPDSRDGYVCCRTPLNSRASNGRPGSRDA